RVRPGGGDRRNGRHAGGGRLAAAKPPCRGLGLDDRESPAGSESTRGELASMSRPRFWTAAVLLPLAFALATYWLFPYGSLGLEGVEDRHRAWLLTLWTAGVMAICFGGAGILSSITPLGFRDVAEAGSLLAA